MSSVISEDLKSIKTKKALYGALFSLLQKNNFRKITIKGVCEEALISRATFYAHFIDKYDLLKHWVNKLLPKNSTKEAFGQMEEMMNRCPEKSRSILKNLFYEADYETFSVLYNFILSNARLREEKNNTAAHSENVVFSNFYAGGMISYLLWQIENNFPPDVPILNGQLYKMLNGLQEQGKI